MNTQNQTGVGAGKALLPLDGKWPEEIQIEASSASGMPETIRYKGRYLYSKYNPTRSVLSLIQGTKFLPGTIIIICSPCLWYGLEQLKSELAQTLQDSHEAGNKDEDGYEICAIEADRKLYALAKDKLNSKEESENVHFIFQTSWMNLKHSLTKKFPPEVSAAY